jgi:hypothetical protein
VLQVDIVVNLDTTTASNDDREAASTAAGKTRTTLTHAASGFGSFDPLSAAIDASSASGAGSSSGQMQLADSAKEASVAELGRPPISDPIAAPALT